MATNAELIKANSFWEDAEVKLWRVAMDQNLASELSDLAEDKNFHFDSFLFELFNYGETEPTDAEIIEAIIENIEE